MQVGSSGEGAGPDMKMRSSDAGATEPPGLDEVILGACFPFNHGGSFLGVCSAQCPSQSGEDAVSEGDKSAGLQELTFLWGRPTLNKHVLECSAVII